MNKKTLLIILGILFILLIIVVLLFARKENKNIDVSQFTKIMQKATPQGETIIVSSQPEDNKETQDVFLKVEFSQPVKVETVQINVVPPIEVKTIVKANQPNILWIEPKGIWDINTKYTVTINSSQLVKPVNLNFTYTPRPTSDYYMDDKPVGNLKRN